MDHISTHAFTQIELHPVKELKPHERNPRTHSKKQLQQIADSISRFGFTNPVVVDDRKRIIAGHGRVGAARLLGMAEVPTLRIDHMSDADRLAYIIADNRVAELAGWDEASLSLELSSILELEPNFDLTLTGFEGGALEALLEAGLSHAVEESGLQEPNT